MSTSDLSPPERRDPPFVADEVTMLRAFLDYQRATFRLKTRGLTRKQMATTHPPSALTLAGLVKHLAFVEDWWFGVTLAGTPTAPPFAGVDWEATPDWELDTAVDHEPDELHALHDTLVAASDAHVENALTAGGLDTVASRRHQRTGDDISLRWILLHMVDEYARHNGHADLLREAVDGSTGV